MQYPNQHPPTGGVPAFPHPPPPPQPQLPPGWVQTTDPVSGRPYFANPVTGQTSWDPPPYFAPPPPPQPQPPHQIPQHQQYQHMIQTQNQVQPTPQPVMPTSTILPPSVVPPQGYPPMPGMPHVPPHFPQMEPHLQTLSQPPQTLLPTSTSQTTTQPSAPAPATSATAHLGPSTAISPGLLVPSVRAMIDAEHTQKLTSGETPKLELDGLTAGAIADLCNVSIEWRSRNVRVHGGDFANDDSTGNASLSTTSLRNDKPKTSNANSGSSAGGRPAGEDGVNQYYLPLQPFSLPVSSRPPHIEPGRVDIRLHALYNKLNKI